MNRLQAIEIFSKQFNDLVEKNKRSWELENSTRDTTLQQKENYYQQELGEKLESMCVLLGIEIDWPGLYPSFKVDGYSYHTFEDALAAKEGFYSIGIMRHEYKQPHPSGLTGEHNVVLDAINSECLHQNEEQ